MNARNRTLISAAVAFVFYFGWTWWVNGMVSDDSALVLRSAFLQASYSAIMTALFTGMLEWMLRRMKCHKRPYLAALPALAIQSIAVIALNVINHTPSLWATVAPSILFSAIYGFSYVFALRKTAAFQCPDAN